MAEIFLDVRESHWRSVMVQCLVGGRCDSRRLEVGGKKRSLFDSRHIIIVQQQPQRTSAHYYFKIQIYYV